MRHLARFRTLTALVTIAVFAASPASALGFGGTTLWLDQGDHVWNVGGDVPGLIAVDLKFRNGDHHVKTVAAHPHNGGKAGYSDFLVHFGDVGDEDPIYAHLYWADLWRWGTPRVVSRSSCSGTCRLTLPRLQQGELFVLAGFHVRNTESGWDRHLRELAIVPQPYLGYVDVTFIDNSATRPYEAAVYYLVLPLVATAGGGTLGGSVASGGSASVPRPAGIAALRGFRLAFTNGDHHLERLTLDLRSNRVLTTFKDDNGDDPYVWWVSYVLLAP